MKEKELKELNDELTEMTGTKHFASVGDMLENKFSQLGYKDDNGNKIEVKDNDEKIIKEMGEQIEKMKCCSNCKHSRTEYEHCRTDKHEKWEIKE